MSKNLRMWKKKPQNEFIPFESCSLEHVHFYGMSVWKCHPERLCQAPDAKFQIQKIVSFHLCFQTLDKLSIPITYSKIYKLFLKPLERSIKTCTLQNYKGWFSTKYLSIQSPVVFPLPSSAFAHCYLFIKRLTFSKKMTLFALISRLLICLRN